MHPFSRLGSAVLITACLVAVWLAPGLEAWAGGRMLIITNPKTGLVASLPLKDVRGLAIRFFHSYDRHWVVESFRVEASRFVPTEVSYSDDSYDYRDQRYESRAVVERSRVLLTEIVPRASDLLKTIATRVAHTKSQQLLLRRADNTEIHLFNQWGQPGQLLVFSIK